MDPTDAEGSFFDRGAGYAPAMYYESPEEKEVIESIIASIDQNGPYEKPLAVLVLERPTFWAAEDFHQDYYKGTLSSVKYQYYRKGSGRDAFIEKYWGKDTGPTLPWQTEVEPISLSNDSMTTDWKNYQKPSKEVLKAELDELAFKVTQEEGTERAGTSPLDKEYGRGIYVDILSGEPLFSSKDKYDSGTGWPSFTAPISPEAVTEHIDKKLFSTRTEIRSAIADNHLGHVFPDGPRDSTGLRYCMNGVALRFVPEVEMAEAGYSEWMSSL
jgi:peptide methionine sulfoxide reductase msrA/msrB